MAHDYETRVLQDLAEHDAFMALLRAENVRSYLELGLGSGGSLWRIANSLPSGSRVVGLDLHIVSAHKNRANIEDGVSRLIGRGYDTHLIAGNSTDPLIIAKARALSPFDCIFIDGCHDYDAVKADWDNYRDMGRMIAFHDISWNETWVSKVPGRVTRPMGVPRLWDEIKGDHRHREIRLYSKRNYYGIGVLWRDNNV